MTTDWLEQSLRQMMLIRAFEERVAAERDSGNVPGLPHLSHGHEAVAVGVASCLDRVVDQVTGSHRSHAVALAMGTDPVALMAEILGLENGLGKGMGGTQHFFAPESGFLASNGIVGGQVPMAAGAALSAKLMGEGGIAVAFMGDGAINQGGVLETMNLAGALKLPLFFVVENNGLAQSTGSDAVTAGPGAVSRARAMAMPAETCDGSNLEQVQRCASRLVDWVRRSGAPALLEARVTRMGGHYHGDTEAYRQDISDNDPVALLAARLEPDTVEAIRADVTTEISRIMETARAGRPADEGTMTAVAAEVLP